MEGSVIAYFEGKQVPINPEIAKIKSIGSGYKIKTMREFWTILDLSARRDILSVDSQLRPLN